MFFFFLQDNHLQQIIPDGKIQIFLRNRLFEWKIVIIGVDTKISIWAKGWDVINACKSKFEVLKM